jgi:hypothetical protein
MTGAANAKTTRCEQLLTMSIRIGDAIEADIAALENGKFDTLKTADPEIERLCAIYGREIKTLKSEGGVEGVPAALVAKLKESGARLNGLLARHERLVGCMKHVSEGLVHAVAEEVQKAREAGVPYAASPKAKRPSTGAIVYNNVV